MIWNEEILFIHAPKTGGMSLTHLLVRQLRGEVFISTPAGERFARAKVVKGRRHEDLPMASDFFAERGVALNEFKHIFAVVREPYTFEISRYNYLRLGHAWDKGHDQAIAFQGDFKAFLRKSGLFGQYPPRLDKYYHLNGTPPKNMSYLRFERLATDVQTYLAPFLEGEVKLEQRNTTGDSIFEKYYDAEAEEICFQRHRWFFDQGLYPRRVGAEALPTTPSV